MTQPGSPTGVASAGGFATNGNGETHVKLNLESLLFIEEKLWMIVEGIRENRDISEQCEEWWEVTDEDSVNSIDRLFRDERLRRGIRQLLILESVAVTLVYTLTVEDTVSPNIVTQLKNLFFYVHQNFLSLIEIII